MKKSFIIEYSVYALARVLGALVVSLPMKVNLFLGKCLGLLGYYLLKKKRRLALKNLKIAFGGQLSEEQLEHISRKAFTSLALTIIETLYIPRINPRYINKHVRIENLKYLDDGLKRGKGVIFLAYHLGNWELANITCGLQGYAYKVIVNEQRYPLLNNLLNRYRESKGCKTIPRGVALREIMRGLKNNEVVAMVGDQGGKEGSLSDFFGLPVSTPTGFARFAFATGACVIPAIIVRERRFSHRIILEKPLKIDETMDEKENLLACLKESNATLERYIRQYPQEYFWFYKMWKYSPFRCLVILSDRKSGHLRQSEALLKIVSSLQLTVHSVMIEVRFKNAFAKVLSKVCLGFGLDILEFCLSRKTKDEIIKTPADMIISCGSSVAGVNLAMARENLGRSVCVMEPGVIAKKGFDALIIPKHDKPAKRHNIVETEGALNLIDDEYLRTQAQMLKTRNPDIGKRASLGLLIGGDTKRYSLTTHCIAEVIFEVKKAAGELDMDILITTSRRTPREIEDTLKEAFQDFPQCKLLVIANEKNIPEAVGGILGFSDFVLVSGESISMVSEAASSGKYVGIFRLKPKAWLPQKTRHEHFLKNLAQQGYIYIVNTKAIAPKIKEVLHNKPQIKMLDDRFPVYEAIRKLL